MKYINETKAFILGTLGLIGTAIADMLGGWNSAMTTLLIFMIIDYAAGLVVAGVFKKSGKSETGALNSSAGWRGLFKKGMTLVIVLVAHRLDLSLGTSFIKDTAIIGYIVNELLSIVENAGLMGINIHPVITQAIDVLRKKGEPNETNSNR